MAMPGSSSTMKIKAESIMLDRQPDSECRTSIELACDLDHTAVIGDDAIGHRQAQARSTAASLRGEEWFKDPLLVTGRNAEAAILYRHAHPFSIVTFSS